MKLKGRRQSNNVHVQTPEEQRYAMGGLAQQEKGMNNTMIRDPNSSISYRKIEDAGVQGKMGRAPNPGKASKARATGQNRAVKDPAPADFEFFPHTTKGK